MRGKILIMFVLALVCGAVSLVVARNWINSQASQRMAAIKAEGPDVSFLTLVVAAEPLRFGTALSSKNLRTIPWPEADLPPGAFTSVDDLLAGEPRSVLFPLEPNEPVLAGKITGAGERSGLSRLIGEGRRAVTIRVNDVAGVAGFILPGDRVDVMLTVERNDVPASDVILQGVKVLSIDQLADERADEPVVAKAVTVEVDTSGAQKIALAQAIGAISLALRRSGEAATSYVATVTPVDFVNGYGGGDEQYDTVEKVDRLAPISRSTMVGVTRAMEVTEYRVPSRDGEGFIALERLDGPTHEAALQ